MESQTLELTIISANNLRTSNPFFTNHNPYVIVWISDTTANFPAQKTPIATNGSRNPIWNHQLTFLIPSTAETRHLTLHLRIFTQRALVSDDLIGELHIPIIDLFHSVSGSPSPTLVSYQVFKPSGRPNGVVLFSYGFVNKILSGDESGQPVVIGYPMNPYPPPPPSAPPVPTKHGPVAEYPRINMDGNGVTGYGYRRKGRYGYPMKNGFWYSGRMSYGCRSGFRWNPIKCHRTGWGAGCSATRWRGY